MAQARMLSELPSDPYLVETKFFHHYAHPQAGPLVATVDPSSVLAYARFGATAAAGTR